MKDLLIVANWKSNITKSEVKSWIDEFYQDQFPEQINIVLLPPFTLLDHISSFSRINDLNLKLGAQDVSPFEAGSYTGEVNATQIKEFAEYVLIGHSERRTNFSETNEIVNNKIDQAIKIGLKPIVCISEMNQVKELKNQDVYLAYEPISAIGTGNPEDSGIVSSFCREIKEKINTKVLYGGSVNSDNIKNYTNLNEIDGVLVGKESLNISSFISLIKNAV
jgi:triosephosphate isomerase (TIM)